MAADTVEHRFNEPLYNEVLGIKNGFLQRGENHNKMYGTETRRYNEHNPETQTSNIARYNE